jgi:hypothetical protein
MAPCAPVYLLAAGRREATDIESGSPQDQVFSLGAWCCFSLNLMLPVFCVQEIFLLVFVLVITSLVKGIKAECQNAKAALPQAVATSAT